MMNSPRFSEPSPEPDRQPSLSPGTLIELGNNLRALEDYAFIETDSEAIKQFGDQDAETNPGSKGVEVRCATHTSSAGYAPQYTLDVAVFVGGDVLEKGFGYDPLSDEDDERFKAVVDEVKDDERDWLEEACRKTATEDPEAQVAVVRSLIESRPSGVTLSDTEWRLLRGKRFDNGTKIDYSRNMKTGTLSVGLTTADRTHYRYTAQDNKPTGLEVTSESRSNPTAAQVGIGQEELIERSAAVEELAAITGERMQDTLPQPDEERTGQFIKALKQALASGDERSRRTGPAQLRRILGQLMAEGGDFDIKDLSEFREGSGADEEPPSQ